MPSSSKTEEYERLVTTDLRRVCQDAGLVLEDWQMRFLVSLITTQGRVGVLRSMRRRTPFCIATGQTSEGQPSTSPENPATPARS